MAQEELQAELDRLRAENERLRAAREHRITLKVSEKGAVSAYGLGRFPVTLYKEQWRQLLAIAGEIELFINENEGRLKSKS